MTRRTRLWDPGPGTRATQDYGTAVIQDFRPTFILARPRIMSMYNEGMALVLTNLGRAPDSVEGKEGTGTVLRGLTLQRLRICIALVTRTLNVN